MAVNSKNRILLGHPAWKIDAPKGEVSEMSCEFCEESDASTSRLRELSRSKFYYIN